MPTHIALLRAMNVGGTGKLPMGDLKAMCENAGFGSVRTYIASGNVVFDSDLDDAGIKTALEKRIEVYAGKPVGVLVRTAAEMADILAGNPFPEKAPNHTVAIFLDTSPPADTLAGVTGQTGEEIRLGRREIYVHYPNGQGRSKLKIRAAVSGTARNMNTVAKLAGMANSPA